jgi:hypothetical protein
MNALADRRTRLRGLGALTAGAAASVGRHPSLGHTSRARPGLRPPGGPQSRVGALRRDHQL